MNDRELELYARHLSLPQIGLPGQERLQQHTLRVDPAFADLARALDRMGVRIQTEASIAVLADELVPTGQVLFDGDVTIGPQAFSLATQRDAAAPLHVK